MLSSTQTNFIKSIAIGKHEPVNSGHMLYRRSIVHHPSQPWFIKAHDPDLFTIDKKRDESLRYLAKEAEVYSHLRNHSFRHIPAEHHFKDGVLLLSGLRDTDGWHWKIPVGEHARTYIRSVLTALDTLQSTPTHTMFDTEPSVDYFWQTGWGTDKSMVNAVATYHEKWGSALHPGTKHSLAKLNASIDDIRLHAPPKISTHMSHHDIRQSNLAWHPELGTVIIDWSWASHGVHHADSTMFLIDLHKSGVDVSEYLDEFYNIEYAKLLIGYWLLRVGEPTAQGNDEVRLHQLASAVSAFELLRKI